MALYEIDADLKTAEATLAHWEKRYPEVARKDAEAAIEHELKWADAIARIIHRELPEGTKPPTVAVMEAEATALCANEIKAKRLAAADLDIAKKLIGIAETQLTSIQTRSRISLAEMSLQ